jgi:methylated-DNA-[protein]-cysteine S-methyltransferase
MRFQFPWKWRITLMDKSSIRTREDVVERLQNKTEFEKAVLVKTFEIPKGRVTTYGRIAEKVGKPQAYRAVANVLHRNPLAPIVPCHRVVRSNGQIVGTKEAVEARRRLLEQEGITLEGNRVKLNPEILF